MYNNYDYTSELNTDLQFIIFDELEDLSDEDLAPLALEDLEEDEIEVPTLNYTGMLYNKMMGSWSGTPTNIVYTTF